MKFFSVLAITALAATVSAQLENLPKCASPCLQTPVGTCAPFDISCSCKAQVADCKNGAAVTACVQKNCPAEKDQTLAGSTFVGICKTMGGGLDISKCIPKPGGGGGTKPPPSSTTTPTTPPTGKPTGGPSPPPTGGCIPRYARRNL